MNPLDPFERARGLLGQHHCFQHGDRTLVIACLIRTEDWRPLRAPWWRGKEVCVVGVDVDGNFLLRHCDGTVRLWDHRLQADSILAPSVREFAARIE